MWLPLEDRLIDPPPGRQPASEGPGVVHCEMYGLAFIGFACERVSTPFAVGPGEAGVGCFYSGITVCPQGRSSIGRHRKP